LHTSFAGHSVACCTACEQVEQPQQSIGPQAHNEVVKEWGKFVKAEHHRYNHVDLVSLLDIVDLQNGATVAGGRGYFLKGAAVLLNQALINCALQHAYKRGSEPIQTPFFMTKSIMAECAQLKEFDEALYHVRGLRQPAMSVTPKRHAECGCSLHTFLVRRQVARRLASLHTADEHAQAVLQAQPYARRCPARARTST
jgi:seryl-tRNA synthetase